MKTILVPTDFSDNAAKALDYTIEIAKKEAVKIVLMHSYRVNYASDYRYLAYDVIAGASDNAEKESDKLLKEFAKKIEMVNETEIEYECLSKESFAFDAILETVKEKEVDLIIMGTKGAGGLKGAFLGSIASRVVEKAPCPVIVIPEHSSAKNIKKITYATDYHLSDFNFMEQLLEIVRPFHAEINFLHISPDDNEGQQELMHLFIYELSKKVHYNNISHRLITGANVVKELEEYIRTESPDLIVMPTRKRNALDKIFNSSITKKLVDKIEIPLLAFHCKKEEEVPFL
ncbi:MAG: universal stress protein [Bacteroidia bacterium]